MTGRVKRGERRVWDRLKLGACRASRGSCAGVLKRAGVKRRTLRPEVVALLCGFESGLKKTWDRGAKLNLVGLGYWLE